MRQPTAEDAIEYALTESGLDEMAEVSEILAAIKTSGYSIVPTRMVREAGKERYRMIAKSAIQAMAE